MKVANKLDLNLSILQRTYFKGTDNPITFDGIKHLNYENKRSTNLKKLNHYFSLPPSFYSFHGTMLYSMDCGFLETKPKWLADLDILVKIAKKLKYFISK